jgi:hypothetical protein
MMARLMTPDDLLDVTGRKRHSAQARWFRQQFSIDVAQRANGSIVMTWETFEAVQARKAGFTHRGSAGSNVELCFD